MCYAALHTGMQNTIRGAAGGGGVDWGRAGEEGKEMPVDRLEGGSGKR